MKICLSLHDLKVLSNEDKGTISRSVVQPPLSSASKHIVMYFTAPLSVLANCMIS